MGIPDPIIGRKLGDYTIVELLGKGGMARVYKGYDEALDRYAAVKVITSDFVATADEVEYKERFQREARAIARLRHPNIVGVYQFSDLDGLYYMAMIFLDGEDLRTRLKAYAEKGEKMPHGEVLQMAREVASALDYAHSQGVIHRDIKPSNIMMTSTGATLTDFGLALSTMEGTAGDTFGSAHYIAPEQAISSARAVPQSDLYSLGVVLYEAFTGKVPFDDPSVMSVALKHLNEPPPRPTETIRNFPSELEDVLMRLLSKEPTDRHQSGAELLLALQRALPLEGDTAEMPEAAAPRASTSYPALDIGVATSKPSMTSAKKSVGLGGKPAQNAQDLIDQTIDEKPTEKQATKRRVPWVLLAAVLVLLLIGGGAFLAFGGDGGDDGNDQPDDRVPIAAETDPTTQTATSTEESADDENEADASQTTVAQSEDASPTATEPEPTPETPTVTVTVTESVAIPTETIASSVTPTATTEDQAATATATTSLTATAPTETATATSTPPPATNTPDPTTTPTTETISGPVTLPTEANPDVELRYEETYLILENVSGRTLNLADLRFEGNESGLFRASEWSRNLETINARLERFRDGGCVQVSTQRSSFQPMNCRWYNVWIPRTLSLFHFFLGDNTMFSIYDGGTLVGQCAVGAETCQFSLEEFDPTRIAEDTETQTDITPSPSPSNTPSPTPSLTATATATDDDVEENATASPTPPLDPDVELRYSAERLLLENVSGQTQNLSALRFETESGQRFSATEWNSSLRQVGASTSSYRSNGCVQVVTTPTAVLNRPCLRYNVWIQRNASSSSYFWGDADSRSFVVLLGTDPIARCPINTSGSDDDVIICQFSLDATLDPEAPTPTSTTDNDATEDTATESDADDTAGDSPDADNLELRYSPDADNLELRYGPQLLILENIGTTSVDISNLVFVGDENGQFSAIGWSNRLEDLDATLNDFEPGGCVQLVVETAAVLEDACTQYNVWIRRGNSSAHFWLDTEENTAFAVTRDGTTIAECPVVDDNDDVVCRFFLSTDSD
jgi:serine/threonine protein kinase